MKLDKLKNINITGIKPDYLPVIVSEVLPSYYLWLTSSLSNGIVDKYSVLKDVCVLQHLQSFFGKKILKNDLPDEMSIKLKFNEAIVFSESLDFFNATESSHFSKMIARKINDQIAPKI